MRKYKFDEVDRIDAQTMSTQIEKQTEQKEISLLFVISK